MKQPLLRFKNQANQSFSDWELLPVGQVMNLLIVPNSADLTSIGQFPLIDLKQVTIFESESTARALNQKPHKFIQRFKKGHILFSRLRPSKNTLLQAQFDGSVCSSEVWILDGVKVRNDFLFHLIQSNAFLNLTNKTSGSSIPRACWNFVSKSQIYIPTFPEQKRLSQFLSAIHDKLSQMNKKQQLLIKYKKGLLNKIFNQSIRFKDQNGEEFPDWLIARISDLMIHVQEFVDPKTLSDDLPCIELSNIAKNTGQLLGHEVAKTQKSLKNKFQKGDILLSRLRPEYRKFLMPAFDGICTPELWVLNGNGISNEFLYQLLQSEGFYRHMYCTVGSKLPRADWKHISKQKIAYPCVAEQNKIVSVLKSLDEKIENLSMQIDYLQRYKSGIFQKMFL